MNVIFAAFSLLTSLCFYDQISQLYKSNETVKTLYTFNRDCLWTTIGFKLCLELTRFVKVYLLL